MILRTLLIHPAVQAIGWALLHFVWQGALLASILFAANALTRFSQANLRYAIACIVMLLMPAVFVITILRGHPAPAPAGSAQYARSAPASTADPQAFDSGLRTTPASGPAVSPRSPTYLASALPGSVAYLWLAGVVALSFYMAGGWLRVQRLKRRHLSPSSAACIEMLDSLKRRLYVSRPVRLYTSAIAEVPTVIGWLRPYILLPVSVLTGLTEPQLRAVLAHELAHIRRHDYLVNLLQSAIETLLFYHPAVWWVSHRIRQEREHCCDDLAVAVCGGVIEYAGALAQLEELRGNVSEPALAATGGDLLARIRRLTGHPPADRIPVPVGAAMAALLVLAAMIGAANVPAIRAQSPAVQASVAPLPPAVIAPIPQAPAQTPQAPNAIPPSSVPTFDAASIKPCAPGDITVQSGGRGGGAGKITWTPGRLRAECQTVDQLIREAYLRYSEGKPWLEATPGVPDPRLSDRLLNQPIKGIPTWAAAERYTIEAESGGTPAEAVTRGPMLEALLENRFGLKLHSETREIPVYQLTVASGGPKLRPAQEGSCIPWGQRPAGPRPPADQRTASNMPCGLFIRSPRNEGLDVNGATLAHLCRNFSVVLDRDVVDRTGIEGLFDIYLDIPPEPRPADEAASQPARPDPERTFSLAKTALRKLGLNLEPAKGKGKFLVIDSVERPSAN